MSTQIVFRKLELSDKPSPGELLVQSSEREALAELALEKGLTAFPQGAGPIHNLVVTYNPTLDDMLAALLVEELLAGRPLAPGAKSFAKYAEMRRGGHSPSLLPGGVPLEVSLDGVFKAMHKASKRDGGDLTEPEAAKRFLKGWGRMAAVVRKAAAAGQDAFTTPLFSQGDEFAKELSFLAQDRMVFHEDLLRGEQWIVDIPGAPRRSPALLLRQPESLLFAQWSRQAAESTRNQPFVFLATDHGKGYWMLSTNPVPGYRLDTLAKVLRGAEAAADPQAAAQRPWELRFEGTLVSNRRTKLSSEKVESLVKHWAHARRPRKPISVAVYAVAGAVLAAALFLAALLGQWLWTLNRLEQASRQVQREIASNNSEKADRILGTLREARDSVYLVMIKDSNGRTFQSQGTAWVVNQKEGILATAAHIAEKFDRATAGQMIARSRGAVHGEFVIKDVKIHPGYKIANRLRRQSRVPRGGSREQPSEPPTDSIAFCDVALLYVENPDGLAPALTLQDTKTLYQLGAPASIGFVGYVIDNNAGFAPDSPEPDQDAGNIAQITDYFDAGTAPPEQQLLVHHRIATAGGASGSPILNRSGNVIAVQSAGNYVFDLGVRIPTGDRYAQRADLVAELLAGSADANQMTRTDEWIEKLDHYADVAQLLQLLTAWKEGLAAKLKASRMARPADAAAKPNNAQLEVTEPFNVTAKLSEAQRDNRQRLTGVYQSTLSFTVHGDGELLLAAYTAKGTRLDMMVYPIKDFGRQAALPIGRDANDRHPFARADVAGTRSFDVVLTGDKDADFSLNGYLAGVAPEERRAVLASDWIAGLPKSTGQTMQYRVLAESSGQTAPLGDGFSGTTAAIELPTTGLQGKPRAGGEYFVVATAKTGEDISLDVYNGNNSGEKSALVKGDKTPQVSPNCAFHANDGDFIVVNVTGPKAGIAFDVVVYTVSQAPAPP